MGVPFPGFKSPNRQKNNISTPQGPEKRLTYAKELRKTAIVWFKRFQAPRSIGLWPSKVAP
jgi:hypothetical protein